MVVLEKKKEKMAGCLGLLRGQLEVCWLCSKNVSGSLAVGTRAGEAIRTFWVDSTRVSVRGERTVRG